ncbi:ribosome-associated protein [Actinobaculum suis]|uniref:Ribosomal silencing factor RsfS n=1 Tax=Actinobaculum suis TaxID=1657 RepID=A0A1G7E0C8_9ACTO|nr:ribosome silencing factor [Actinobaculum suis]MDY5153255.1 ribosome silencing factor [Actinobaculum suis]SDE56896.1 ribosome-associated protein [Actinobaculum suis]
MTASERAIELARAGAAAAAEVKATTIEAIDVSDRLIISDVFLIVTGSSEPQINAIVRTVENALVDMGAKRLRREGLGYDAGWVLLDYGELVVHVQGEEEYEEYALPKLWAGAPKIDLGLTNEELGLGEETDTATPRASLSEPDTV